MPQMQPWRYDRKLTCMMIEDMIIDPILGARVILGLDIPPHQEIRIYSMWYNQFTLDDSGFSTGKSTTIAIVCALRSILFRHRVSGIISGSFRQGKLILANYLKWLDTSSIFRSCVKKDRNGPRFIKGNDQWFIEFRGGSMAKTLPPDFIKDSPRVQSERWNDGYFDEWDTYKLTALKKVLIGRVSAYNADQNCRIRMNHIHLLGTPKGTNHESYAMVKVIDGSIERGSKTHCHFTSNYRHVPRTKRFSKFVDYRTIANMQLFNPKASIESEVDGIWTENSQSFYDDNAVNDARSAVISVITSRKDDADIFIAGFDVARGSSKAKRSKGGDDFSVSIGKISPSNPEIVSHVLTVRRTGVTAEQCAGIIQSLNRVFTFACIVFDPGGGGLYVQDELKKDLIEIRGVKTEVVPIITRDDDSGVIGDMILVPFRRSSDQISSLWGKMASDSVLVNRAHSGLRKLIESRNIILAAKWKHWGHGGLDSDLDAKRDWLNKNKAMRKTERAYAESDLAVSQLLLVDIERKDGNPQTDSFGMFKFKSPAKKDSAYSLLYMSVAFQCYTHSVKIGNAGNNESMAMSSGSVQVTL